MKSRVVTFQEYRQSIANNYQLLSSYQQQEKKLARIQKSLKSWHDLYSLVHPSLQFINHLTIYLPKVNLATSQINTLYQKILIPQLAEFNRQISHLIDQEITVFSQTNHNNYLTTTIYQDQVYLQLNQLSKQLTNFDHDWTSFQQTLSNDLKVLNQTLWQAKNAAISNKDQSQLKTIQPLIAKHQKSSRWLITFQWFTWLLLVMVIIGLVVGLIWG